MAIWFGLASKNDLVVVLGVEHVDQGWSMLSQSCTYPMAGLKFGPQIGLRLPVFFCSWVLSPGKLWVSAATSALLLFQKVIYLLWQITSWFLG